jgi:hypothetical protein
MSPSESIQHILSAAEKDSVFLQIRQDLMSPTDSHINVTGMTDCQKAYVAIALAQKLDKKPVFLVSDELKARTMQLDLAAFCVGDVLIFRQKELNLADVDA